MCDLEVVNRTAIPMSERSPFRNNTIILGFMFSCWEDKQTRARPLPVGFGTAREKHIYWRDNVTFFSILITIVLFMLS